MGSIIKKELKKQLIFNCGKSNRRTVLCGTGDTFRSGLRESFFWPAELLFHFIDKISENFNRLGADDCVLVVDDKQGNPR